MVLSKGVKRCYGILLVLFITVFLSLSVCLDANALTLDYNRFRLRMRYSFGDEYVSTPPMYYGVASSKFNVKYVDRVATAVNVNTSVSSNTYMIVTAKFNLVGSTFANEKQYLPYNNGDPPSIYDVLINGTSVPFDSSSISIYTTDWRGDPYDIGQTMWLRTFTYKVSFIVRNVPTTINEVNFGIEYPGRLETTLNDGASYYFEGTSNNRCQIDFASDYQSSLMSQQIQLQTINNTLIQQEQDQNNEAYANISGQDTSDIQNATNSQTTSIIGVISSFISVLSGFSASTCELILPFPSNLGGDTVVNVCSGKEKAPTIVTIGSSLLLITVFVPLAYIVLRMIYNEIRSWTNG